MKKNGIYIGAIAGIFLNFITRGIFDFFFSHNKVTEKPIDVELIRSFFHMDGSAAFVIVVAIICVTVAPTVIICTIIEYMHKRR